MKIIQTNNRINLLNFCCGKVNLPNGEENSKFLFLAALSALTVPVVGREGFEPSNSEEDRFTVWCRWPLGYLPYLLKVFTFKEREPKKGLEPPTS